jgi:thioredoxin 1
MEPIRGLELGEAWHHFMVLNKLDDAANLPYLDAFSGTPLLCSHKRRRRATQRILMAITAVSEATFQNEVKEADKPVLVDFWAEWCGPCRMVAPILEELSKELEGQLKVVKLDVESNPGIAQAYNIRGIPALLLFKDGEVADQRIGALPKQQLKAWLSEAVA